MKKKILLALSLIAIITVLFAISISAAEPVETWDISATDEDSVIAMLYVHEKYNDFYSLTISGSGNMKNWSEESSPWSSYMGLIISVDIENGVTNIGNWAFQNGSNMTELTIPNSVKSIGWGSFTHCTVIKSIEIPNSLEKIGYYAFQNCASLESITLPNTISVIPIGAFYHCSKLSRIEISNSVTTIGANAFYGCTYLKSIAIPNSVVNIGNSTFKYCTQLEIYAEAESQPSGWHSYWNPNNRPVVWDYKNTIKNDVFTFKGYSFGALGQISFGFDIDYESKALYEELTGDTLEMGVVFAGYDLLGGNQPLDDSGKAIELALGMVVKVELDEYTYTCYDFVLRDITDTLADTKLVISAYMNNGSETKYVQENGLSDTVTGVTYNEVKESIAE